MKQYKFLKIITQLLKLVKSQLFLMFLAILFGVMGHLCAIFVPVLSIQQLVNASSLTFSTFVLLLISLAIFRGVFHYLEQYFNHYIAFKILAIIRHQVFDSLQKNAHVKLNDHDKGNIIAVLTTDIELLEVFYAHTISPIVIAIITSFIMLVYLANLSWVMMINALLVYLIIGWGILKYNAKKTQKSGQEYRTGFGDLNSFVLETIKGVKEYTQYNYWDKVFQQLATKINQQQKIKNKLNKFESLSYVLSDGTLLFVVLLCVMQISLFLNESLEFFNIIISLVAILSSCGPVYALASLSNNLNQTFASANRVLTLLAEQPMINDNLDGETRLSSDMEIINVDFDYGEKNILTNLACKFPSKTITGIKGPSGCGKSTIAKLLMRHYDPKKGTINLGMTNLKDINSIALKNSQGHVKQDTYIFQKTIFENIALANPQASLNEVKVAANHAGIHDFIMSLPQQYSTTISMTNNALSQGEIQRIGLARLFLHNPEIMILDEPTSNLDSLNEAIILKSIMDYWQKKTIIIISHRTSTLAICDQIITLK